MERNYKEKIIEKYSGGGEVNRAERTGKYATSLNNHALFICRKSGGVLCYD